MKAIDGEDRQRRRTQTETITKIKLDHQMQTLLLQNVGIKGMEEGAKGVPPQITSGQSQTISYWPHHQKADMQWISHASFMPYS